MNIFFDQHVEICAALGGVNTVFDHGLWYTGGGNTVFGHGGRYLVHRGERIQCLIMVCKYVVHLGSDYSV